MTWLITIAYLTGWAWTARTLAIRMIDGEAREELTRRNDWQHRFHEPHRNDGKPLVDTEGRILGLGMGTIIGTVWPLALIVLAVANRLRTPTEIAEAERAELEALRKLARDHGLPMP